jgi:hypothetical protein
MELIAIPENLIAFLEQSNLKIKVHSRFKNTLNLKVNHLIIALQEPHLPLTPYSISVSKLEMNEAEFKRAIDKDLNIKHKIKNLKILDNIVFDAKNLKAKLRQVLSRNLNRSQLASAIFKPSLDNYFSNLVKLDISKNLNQFVGLGDGLTPAGDDFIIGYILGASLLNKNADDLKFKLSQDLKVAGATNDISRQYIEAGIDGIFNEYVINLVKVLHTGKDVLLSLQKIADIGASSGLDLLAGLYLSLN